MPPVKEKKRYGFITYRVDNYLRDRFIASRSKRTRENCSEGCVRCLNLTKFCLVFSGAMLQALAPWMLSIIEVLAVLLIFFLATSRPNVTPPNRYHFSYKHCLEDIVGLACTRAGLLSIAYAGGQRYVHRPYLYASYLLAAACFPYIIVKTILYRYGSDAVAAAALFVLTGAFCWIHVFAARATVSWAKRRFQMGLMGFGIPWDGSPEGEEVYWSMLRRSDLEEAAKTSDGGGEHGDDLPPEMLADPDSHFVDIGGIKVHYKEALPNAQGAGDGSSTVGSCAFACGRGYGVVLVHGFGGGVFAWRHAMEALAMQCQCRVVAFDRPGFGLTSRPRVSPHHENPYTVAAQARLLLQLCSRLGLSHAVLVGHADGCLVALKAASLAASWAESNPQFSRSGEHTPSGGPPSPLVPPPPPPSRSQQQPGEGQGLGLDSSAASLAGSSVQFPSLLGSSYAAAGMQALVALQAGGAAQGTPGSAQAASCIGSVPEGGWSPMPTTSVMGAAGSPGDIGEVDQLHGSHSVQLDDQELGGLESSGFVAHPGTTPAQDTISGGGDRGGRHRRCKSLPGSVLQGLSHSGSRRTSSTNWSSTQEVQPEAGTSGSTSPPLVLALALLHPNLSGQVGPALSRLLARSKLGRSILRPLLRTEVGEVANRRAWHDTGKLTPEVLELYKAPLRVEGWDTALIETTRLKREFTPADMASYFGDIRLLPALVVTGEHDRIVAPTKAESICLDLPRSRLAVLTGCGHLSHEEAPGALLAELVPFCGSVIRHHFSQQQHQQQQSQCMPGHGNESKK